MSARLTVLASGSSGNATLLEANGFGLLIDCGLPAKDLTARLLAAGASWDRVHAVVLTHTHSDHWTCRSLAELRGRRIPLYAHQAHLDRISESCKSLGVLQRARLVRTYSQESLLVFAPGFTGRPVWVSHDSDPTFGFRLDYQDGDDEPAWSVGYAADLGCGSEELVEAFAGVDVLALEYNHDEKMERDSPRPRYLVQRVLGERGHLSNRQAAEITRAIAFRSGPMFPTHLVQLHLSKDCNHASLAEACGRNALADLSPAASVITAKQHAPSRSIPLSRHAHSAHRRQPRPGMPTHRVHFGSSRPAAPVLPGFEV